MGWNFSVLHLAPPAAHLVELGEEGFVDADSEVDAWARASAAGLTIVSRSIFDTDAVEELATKTHARIVMAVFSSVASTYLLDVYETGNRIRRIIKTEDAPADGDGAPLPEEAHPDVINAPYDEDKYAALLAATGRFDIRVIDPGLFRRVLSPTLV